jgi:hypothetical protein
LANARGGKVQLGLNSVPGEEEDDTYYRQCGFAAVGFSTGSSENPFVLGLVGYQRPFQLEGEQQNDQEQSAQFLQPRGPP